MQWLRTNAASFGGDDRLTIFGESAGATSVTVHLCSRLSRSIFGAAAMESGAFAYWAALPMHEATQQLNLLLKRTACPDVACLRALDARNLTLIANNYSVFARSAGKHYATSWAPTVDGIELTALPGELLAQGQCAPVPLLLGVNRDEGTSSVEAPNETLLRKGYNMTMADLHTFFTMWLRNESLVDDALRLYRVGSSPRLSRPYWAATHLLGDLMFTCPELRGARHYARARVDAPVFSYFFDHVPRNPPFSAGVPGFNGSSGVSHAFELQFVWQGLPPSWAPHGTLVGADERLLARTMAMYWTNFARSGDPNVGSRTPLTVQWPRAQARKVEHAHEKGAILEALQLDLPSLSTVTGRASHQCEFIDALGAIPYPV